LRYFLSVIGSLTAEMFPHFSTPAPVLEIVQVFVVVFRGLLHSYSERE